MISGSRVDREGEIGEHDRRQAEEERRGEAPPVAHDEPVAAVELARHRVEPPHQADHEVAVRIDVFLHPLEDAVGEHDQRRTEWIDHEVELLDQRAAGKDEDAAHDQRRDDAPVQEPGPALVGNAEVREQDQEDEQVVERQRALDQIDRGVENGVLAALQQQDGDDREQRHHQPTDRPDDRLPEAGLAPTCEEVKVEPEEDEDRDDQPDEEREVGGGHDPHLRVKG
jgi:hypothetical protein